MDSLLPATGTAALLRAVSPYVPDDFINSLWPAHHGRGRRRVFHPAQLWRTHLLALLTPVHSFNLLVEMLPEQRAWRHFAHLPNRRRLPDAWMLHEFRQRAGVAGLRRINEYLLESLLPPADASDWSVSLMDATDLVAADCGFKKKLPAAIRPSARPWVRAP
jgi:hypothetical protein